MTQRKIKFRVQQIGPIELTENLGSDPAFKVPIVITCSSKTDQKALKEVTGIYYHASQGWVPCNDNDELSLSDLIKDHDNFQAALQSVLDDLGASVLARLFRLGEALYDKRHLDVATALLDNDISLKAFVMEGRG